MAKVTTSQVTKLHWSFMVGLTPTILVATSSSVKAQTIPP